MSLLKTFEMVEDQFTFPDTVTVLKSSNGSVVYLVGTAHFSTESQEDVAQVWYKIQNT